MKGVYIIVLAIALAASPCLAQYHQRKLLHGGHSHDEAASSESSQAMSVPSNFSVMNAEYTSWFDYLNKTGHESPTDFILDSLAAPGTVNKANLSEVLYVVGQSQCVSIS